MEPTLFELDTLIVTPAKAGTIRAGDVIAFRLRASAEVVAHRVVGMSSRGLLTRGDAVPRHDHGRVDGLQVLGRINSVIRNGRRIEIAGGPLGDLKGSLCLARTAFRRLAKSAAAPLCDILPRTLLAATIRRLMKKRIIITVRRGEESNEHLVLGGRPIGTRSGGDWRLRYPYALFLDRRAELP